MSAFLVQFALSNVVLSAVLAAVAYAVHRRGRYPVLAHLLWVLVLVKMVTLPLLSLPLAPIPASSGLTTRSAAIAGVASAAPSALGFGVAWLVEHGIAILLLAWALGSAVVLVASLLRIRRFDHLLRRTSSLAPAGVQWLAHDVARQLGIRSAPTIHITSARLSPMTWWAGGPVRVVIPGALLAEIGGEQLRWVLAHELGHVKRRDHLVRWLEWLACVTFWWNPVAWWARRNLRFAEEASCDALVLDRLGAHPRHYADALLSVVELVSRPAFRPPAVATGIDGSGSLERRLRMIISGQPARRVPKRLVAGVLAASLVVMPLGVGDATDHEATAGLSAGAGSSLAGPQAVDLSQPELAFLGLDVPFGSMPSAAAVADGGALALLSASTVKLSTKLAPKRSTKAAKARNARNARKRAARKALRQAASATVSTAAPSGIRNRGVTAKSVGRVLRF